MNEDERKRRKRARAQYGRETEGGARIDAVVCLEECAVCSVQCRSVGV